MPARSGTGRQESNPRARCPGTDFLLARLPTIQKNVTLAFAFLFFFFFSTAVYSFSRRAGRFLVLGTGSRRRDPAVLRAILIRIND